MATERYQGLRDALAAGPTPGPWSTVSRGAYWHEEEADVRGPDGGDIQEAEFVQPIGDVPTTRGQMYMRDAAYIAAADPDTIRALLAERDAAVAERDALRAATQGLLNALPSATTHPAIAAARAALEWRGLAEKP